MTNDEIDQLILKHGAMDQWPTQKQCHAFARAIRSAALEEVARLCDVAASWDLQEFAGYIRALKTKEGE